MFEFHNCFLIGGHACFNAVHIDQLAPLVADGIIYNTHIMAASETASCEVIASPLVLKPSQVVGWNLDPAKGPLFIRTRITITERELAPGTPIGSVGISYGRNVFVTQAFTPGVYTVYKGGQMQCDSLLYAVVSERGVKYSAGDNPLSECLLGRKSPSSISELHYKCDGEKIPVKFRSGVFSLLAAARDTYKSAELFSGERSVLKILPAAEETERRTLHIGPYLFSGIESCRFFDDAGTLPDYKAQRQDILSGLAPAASDFADNILQAEERAVGGNFVLTREGGELYCYENVDGRLKRIDTSLIAGENADSFGVDKGGDVYLFGKTSPKVRVFKQSGGGLQARSVLNPELFDEFTTFYLSNGGLPISAVRKTAEGAEVCEFARYDIEGELSFSCETSFAFASVRTVCSNGATSRLYIDEKGKQVKFMYGYGIEINLAETLKPLLYAAKNVAAAEEYILILTPAMKVYNAFTGREMLAREARGLLTGHPDYFVECGETGFKLNVIDRMADTVRCVGEAVTGKTPIAAAMAGDLLLLKLSDLTAAVYRICEKNLSVRIMSPCSAEIVSGRVKRKSLEVTLNAGRL